MQPDAYTFLQSARREMRIAAEQGASAPRMPYLARGALVVERLAFHADGLEALLAGVLPRQRDLLARLQALLPAAADAPPQHDSALAAYEDANRRIDAALATLLADPRTGQDAFAARVDALVREVSRFGYDVTREIDRRAQERARQWENGRPTIRPIAVTAERLSAYLRERHPELPALRVTDVEPLVGMNANEAFFIRIEGHPDWPERLILRRALPVRIQPTPLTEEFAILQAMHGTAIPVPRPVFCDGDPAVLGTPFIALERLRGETLPLTQMGARGKQVYLQLAALMGRLHALDPALLPAFRRAANGDAHAWLLRRIAVYEEEWRNCAREPVHTVTAAFHWLRRHAGAFLSTQVIVHGDIDHRNLLVDEDRIVALIDWEVSHQGHPAEDLAFVREHVEQLMDWREFMAVYRDNGGHAVTAAELRYAKVLSNLLRVTTSMIAHLAYVDGTIDNFLMGTVRTIETEAACQRLHEAIESDPEP